LKLRAARSGRAFEQVDAQLAGALFGRAANTSAPGDNRISADVVQVFWQWEKLWITQLVRNSAVTQDCEEWREEW